MPSIKTEIFDFCETIVDIQSGDFFIDYLLENGYLRRSLKGVKLVKYIFQFLKKTKIMSLLYRVYPKSTLWEKNYRISVLQGTDSRELNSAISEFNKILKSHIIQETWEVLIDSINKNKKVIILSAGYGIYLRDFFKELSEVIIIASELEINNHIFTGKLNGKDCFGSEKITKLSKQINIDDLRPIRVFSDSITDLPILELGDEAVVVSKGTVQTWAVENGFNSIVY